MTAHKARLSRIGHFHSYLTRKRCGLSGPVQYPPRTPGSGSFFSISTFPSSPLVSAPFSPPASNLAVLLSLRWIGIFLGSPGIAEHMADEEPSDPKALLEERSKAKCVSQWYEYQKCVKRIADDETGQKHCTGQYFDYWQCVDKNVAEKLFQKLK